MESHALPSWHKIPHLQLPSPNGWGWHLLPTIHLWRRTFAHMPRILHIVSPATKGGLIHAKPS